MANENNGPPSASDALHKPERRPWRPSASPAGVLLRNFFIAMNAVGDDAEEQYRRALADLRKHADQVVVEIARSQSVCETRDYPMRWAHIHAAAELRHPAALPFLLNLILTPIPPEQSLDPHSFSSVAEETILRTTAVEGIGYLAKSRAEAVEALFEALRQPSVSVRRAAVHSLLASSRGGKLRARIAKALPENQQFLLNLKAADVRDVPQVTRPQRYLSDAGKRASVGAAPSLPGDESTSPNRDTPPTRKD